MKHYTGQCFSSKLELLRIVGVVDFENIRKGDLFGVEVGFREIGIKASGFPHVFVISVVVIIND